MTAGAGKAIISEKDIKYLETGKPALHKTTGEGKIHAVKIESGETRGQFTYFPGLSAYQKSSYMNGIATISQ